MILNCIIIISTCFFALHNLHAHTNFGKKYLTFCASRRVRIVSFMILKIILLHLKYMVITYIPISKFWHPQMCEKKLWLWCDFRTSSINFFKYPFKQMEYLRNSIRNPGISSETSNKFHYGLGKNPSEFNLETFSRHFFYFLQRFIRIFH